MYIVLKKYHYAYPRVLSHFRSLWQTVTHALRRNAKDLPALIPIAYSANTHYQMN